MPSLHGVEPLRAVIIVALYSFKYVIAALLVLVGYLYPATIPYLLGMVVGYFVLNYYFFAAICLAILGAFAFFSWKWLFCSGSCLVSGSPAVLWLAAPAHIALVVAIYFLPTVISIFFKSKTTGIFIANLFLGWTVIMWISLFLEAFRDPSVDRYGLAKPRDEYAQMLDEPSDRDF